MKLPNLLCCSDCYSPLPYHAGSCPRFPRYGELYRAVVKGWIGVERDGVFLCAVEDRTESTPQIECENYFRKGISDLTV
jgi:hypothetical protein